MVSVCQNAPMTSASTERDPDDDVVDLPHLDIDTERQAGGDDEPERPGHTGRGRTPASARWRWLGFPAVFLAGGLLGAYIADVRTETEAVNTVTAGLGGLEVVPGSVAGFGREEPVRVTVDVLNTSDRDIVVTGASVPGMLDDGDHAVIKSVEVAPGEWGTVTVIEHDDCYARDLAPVVAVLDVTTSDGGQHQVEATGPHSMSLNLGRTLQTVCSS